MRPAPSEMIFRIIFLRHRAIARYYPIIPIDAKTSLYDFCMVFMLRPLFIKNIVRCSGFLPFDRVGHLHI